MCGYPCLGRTRVSQSYCCCHVVQMHARLHVACHRSFFCGSVVGACLQLIRNFTFKQPVATPTSDARPPRCASSLLCVQHLFCTATPFFLWPRPESGHAYVVLFKSHQNAAYPPALLRGVPANPPTWCQPTHINRCVWAAKQHCMRIFCLPSMHPILCMLGKRVSWGSRQSQARSPACSPCALLIQYSRPCSGMWCACMRTRQ